MANKSEYSMGCPLCYVAGKLVCMSCGQIMTPQLADAMTNYEPMTRLRDQVRCNACYCEFPAYLLAEDTFKQVAAVQDAIRGCNEGRNLSCWPLCSFGGKDADLEASGCTGIKRLVGVDGDKLIFAVGGHKTVCGPDCLDTDDEGYIAHYTGVAQDLMCGCEYAAEWSDDEWVVSHSELISVRVVNCQDEAHALGINADATALACILQAQKALEPFEEAMRILTEHLNVLYDQCVKSQEKQT